MNVQTSPTPQYRLSALFLIAVVFACLAPKFWQEVEINQGSVAGAYENSDLYQYEYPALEYGFGQLRQGRLPLWNPTQLCGTPYQADQRVGVFQPLNFLFLVCPTAQAMAVHAFACLFLMGTFFSFFARSLGVRYIPALIGGVAYAFSGAAASAMSRPDTAAALAWAALVFWAVNEYGRQFRYSMAVVAGAALGLLILSGAYAVVAAMSCLLLPFLLWITVFPRAYTTQGLFRRIIGVPIIFLIALVLSAIQWVPTVAWLKTLDSPWMVLWSLRLAAEIPTTPRELMAQVLTSTPGALPRLAYPGIAVLLLMPASLAHRARWRETSFFLLAGGALLVFLLLRQGLLPEELPFAALIFPIAFSVASLAALGADRLLVPRRDHRSPGIWHAALLVLAAAFGMFLIASSQGRGYVAVVVLVILPFVFARARLLAPLCGLGLAAVLFIDLIVASVNTYRHPYQDAPGCYQRLQTVIGFAQQQALGGRVLISSSDIDAALPANTGMITGLQVAGGAYLPLTVEQAAWWHNLAPEASPLLPTHVTALPDALQPGLLDFMAARFVAAAADGPLYNGEWGGARLRMGQEGANVRMFVNEGAFPRAYWASTWRLVNGMTETVDALADATLRAEKGCVVDSASPGVSELAVTGMQANPTEQTPAQDTTCSVEDVSPERVIVRVQAPAQGVTVLADTFAPGWIARLDNEPCPILRANGIFRGVATPPGTHEIVFEYRPLSFRIGKALSLSALGALVLAGFVVLGRFV